MELDLGTILTAGGAVAAAGLISGVVELLKRLPRLGDWIKSLSLEPVFAFVFSAVLVVLSYVATVPVKDLGNGFMAFLAWYGIARLSMTVYDDVTAAPNSLRG